jgi:uncharacterized protein (DUF1778 family)
MPKGSDIKMIAVYATEDQKEIVDRTAQRVNRSTSNFLLSLALEKAEELGITIKGAAKKKKAANAG